MSKLDWFMKYPAIYWMKMTYPELKILDYDGFDRNNLKYSFEEEEISYMEFERRIGLCTVTGKLGGWDKDIDEHINQK